MYLERATGSSSEPKNPAKQQYGLPEALKPSIAEVQHRRVIGNNPETELHNLYS